MTREPLMIREHDTVVLTRDLPERRLRVGDVGTVVHVHDGAAAYEVEFVSGAGKVLAVVTLAGDDVRPVADAEILHVRALS